MREVWYLCNHRNENGAEKKKAPKKHYNIRRYNYGKHDDKNTFVRINADKILGIDKLEKITGGDESGHFPQLPNRREEELRCPVTKGEHNYVMTGESRPTKRWFYKTEEHYVCACGSGFCRAGIFRLDIDWD